MLYGWATCCKHASSWFDSFSHHFMDKRYIGLQELKPFMKVARNITIVESMINKTVEVHNGLRWTQVSIKPNWLGHKIGEFIFTKKKVIFKKKK